MNAKKLPSGKYNARVFDYTDIHGKKIYKSFTADTKREAERMALEYKDGMRGPKTTFTVAQAIDGYIEAKEDVLSPSTIRGYRQIQNRYFSQIGHKRIQSITTSDLQRFVSALSREVSPKTVSNVYGLLTSALKFYDKSIDTNVTLPKKPKRRPTSPSDEQVQALFHKAESWLKISIALAAFGSLRRGEICAIRFRDVDGNTVHIHADMVKNASKEWVLKEIPKTSESDRIVALPASVIDMFGEGDPDDFIVKNVPDSITKRFIELRDSLGISIRFHDLRHYFASIGVAIGIPDLYLANMGGWGNSPSSALKSIYQNKIVPVEELYQKKMVEHFNKMIE